MKETKFFETVNSVRKHNVSEDLFIGLSSQHSLRQTAHLRFACLSCETMAILLQMQCLMPQHSTTSESSLLALLTQTRMCHTEISTYTCGHSQATVIHCNHRAAFDDDRCLEPPTTNERDPLKVHAPCFHCAQLHGRRRLGKGRNSGQARCTVPSGTLYDDPAIVDGEYVRRQMDSDPNCGNPEEEKDGKCLVM
ncbi:hypothetical protein AC578_1885 [Pseudocercospora eumusae]|uniref:Uncharacterized protein n=1 Tax=Pseudocercospora eumusae TaxID=321146 RepID=A0A139H3Q3_9PEZI|nr:hypothetical protein AC578_1885 [Pseudocercospora eumusae]